jgi:hypothetical protein
MKFLQPLLIFLLLSLSAGAQVIEGSVVNGTTGKPDPGAQVVLFASAGEQARTTTDEKGNFKIAARSSLDPHSPVVLQVTHDGVEYFQEVAAGRSAKVMVYDATGKPDGVSGCLSILQFQVKDNVLQVTELHALNNTSNPPATRVSPDNLVISVPEGAKLDPALVSGPDGGALRVSLVPALGQQGRYKVDFPLKPGMTKYAITYQVPFNGELVFRRRPQYAMKRIGVIVPDSMRFHSLGPAIFQSVADQPGTRENVIESLAANQGFAFKLSGTGGLPRLLSPLSPGQPSGSAEVATEVKALIRTPWPQPIPHAATPGSSPARASSLRPSVTLAASILACIGFMIWSFKRKRVVRT